MTTMNNPPWFRISMALLSVCFVEVLMIAYYAPSHVKQGLYEYISPTTVTSQVVRPEMSIQKALGDTVFPAECISEANGDKTCMYPEGLCTDFSSILLRGPSPSSLTDPTTMTPYTYDPVYKMYQLSPKSVDTRVPPFTDPVELKFESDFPADTDVEWVDVLAVNPGPIKPDCELSHMQTLIAPLTTLLRYFEEQSIPEEYHAPTIAMINTEYSFDPATEPETTTAEAKIWYFIRALLGKYPHVSADHIVSKATRKDGGKKWMCARKGIVMGNTDSPMTGRLDKIVFRSSVMKYFGIDTPTSAMQMKKKPLQVTLLAPNSGDEGDMFDGRFDNLKEMIAVMDNYTHVIEYSVVNPSQNMGMKEMAQLYAKTSLLIAPHGTPMVNALLIADQAVVIEIFPFGIFMDAYQRMSTQTGLLYIPFYSNLQGSRLTWHYEDQWKDAGRASTMAKKCLHAPRLGNNECWPELLHASIHAPILEFELHLYNGIHNLDVYPDKGSGMPLLIMQGMEPYQDGKKLIYPNYARAEIEPVLVKHGKTWEEFHEYV